MEIKTFNVMPGASINNVAKEAIAIAKKMIRKELEKVKEEKKTKEE